MPNVHPDHRVIPRTTLNLVVQFERTASMVRPAQAPMGQAVGYDISARGAGFLTNDAMRPGEILRLLLPFEASHTPVPVMSEVRWSLEVPGGFRVGLQFLA